MSYKVPRHWLSVAVVALLVPSALAQEPTPAAPGPRIVIEVEEGGDVLGVPAPPPTAPGIIVEAAPSVRFFGGEASGAWVMPFAYSADESTGGMVQDPRIQKELELVEDQTAKIRKVYADMHAETRRFMRETRQPSPDGKPAGPPVDFGKRVRELQSNAERQVDEILLPHQQKRLKQIALRSRMKSRGTAGTLTDDKLAKELEITDAQKEKLHKKSQEVQKDLEAKIAKLREEARQEILGELTDSQRKKLDDLLGDEYDASTVPTSPRVIRAPRAQ